MKRKNKIRMMCLIGQISLAALSVQAKKQPNFVLLLTDDQSYHLGMLGVQGLETPNIDALAKRGVFFTKAYSASASCAPCRGSILTGMYPSANGHWRNTIGPVLADPDQQFGRNSSKADKVGVHEDIPTLVELLNAAGYFTGITEKWHLSPPWKFPFAFRDPANLTPQGSAKAVARFIDSANGKPFFLQANIDNTHRPFRHHIEQNPGLPKVDPVGVEVPPNWPDTPKTRQDYAEYLTTVQHADAVVGAILKVLADRGELENTIFIYTSDQGFCYPRAKASAYDWGLHVPFAFAGPGVERGVVSSALVGHVDIMPTVLDYAGLPIPGTVQGKSLRRVLEGKAVDVGRKFIVSVPQHHRRPLPLPLEPAPRNRAGLPDRPLRHRPRLPRKTQGPGLDAVGCHAKHGLAKRRLRGGHLPQGRISRTVRVAQGHLLPPGVRTLRPQERSLRNA